MNLFLRFLKLSVLAFTLTLPQSGGVLAKTIAPDFVELAKKLKPSVVNISTAKTIAPQKQSQINTIHLGRTLLTIFSTASLTFPSIHTNNVVWVPASSSAIRVTYLPITTWWPAPMKSR